MSSEEAYLPSQMTMPIEQVFEHYDKDRLKMAMLKHEETFRQQVHELHRLYRIQKLLMRDLKRELKSQSNMSTSPNGFAEYSRAALDAMRSYEQCYGAATRGGAAVRHAAEAARAALSLDVVMPAVEYAQSPEEDAEETDDDEEEAAELELTLAVGTAASVKKRYNRNEHSPGLSFSSSSTESDVLVTGVRDWQAHGGATADADAASPPYHHKRRPPAAAAFDVVQVDDSGVQAPPPPLLFHWLSLRMA